MMKKIYKTLDLEKSYFFEMKDAGMTDADVCRRIGTHGPRLAQWKDENLTPEERKKYSLNRKNAPKRHKPESLHSSVTSWKMSEEERQAYLEKHPIVPKPKKSHFVDYKTI